MNIVTLAITFSLTIALAIWAVIKGEREKKAKKLFTKILFDHKSNTIEEIQTILEEEQQKRKKDFVKIIALKRIIEHKIGDSEPTFKDEVNSLFKSIWFILKCSLYALIPTSIIGFIVYMLSLIISIVQVNIVFIGIVFVISFIFYSIRELSN